MPKPAWTLALILFLAACGKEEAPVAEPPEPADPPAVEQPQSPSDVTRLVLEKKIAEIKAEIAKAETELSDIRAKMEAVPGGEAVPAFRPLQEEAAALEKLLVDLQTQLSIKQTTLRNLPR